MARGRRLTKKRTRAGALIKEYRDFKAMTQEAFAEKYGVDHSTISLYEIEGPQTMTDLAIRIVEDARADGFVASDGSILTLDALYIDNKEFGDE